MSLHTDESKTSRAVILRFPKKRGRPKSTRPSVDLGTPELAMKRLMGETTEALDLCLEREIITPQQHWCGVHLRWLYTLRYGSPGLTAINPTHLGGSEIRIDDLTWREEREREYMEAIKKLHRHHCATALLNLCAYNEKPPFLNIRKSVTLKRAEEAQHAIDTLRRGLDILVKLWSRDALDGI